MRGKSRAITEQVGKNVVLFSHACGLKRYEIPDGTEIEVRRYHGDPDDPDHSIGIWETVPDNPEQKDSVSPMDGVFDLWGLVHLPDSPEVEVDASIRLDMESIEVQRVEGVSYQSFRF